MLGNCWLGVLVKIQSGRNLGNVSVGKAHMRLKAWSQAKTCRQQLNALVWFNYQAWSLTVGWKLIDYYKYWRKKISREVLDFFFFDEHFSGMSLPESLLKKKLMSLIQGMKPWIGQEMSHMDLISVLYSREWQQKGENFLQWLWTRYSHLRRKIFSCLRNHPLGLKVHVKEESRAVTDTGLVVFLLNPLVFEVLCQSNKGFSSTEGTHRDFMKIFLISCAPAVGAVSVFARLHLTQLSPPPPEVKTSLSIYFSDCWVKPLLCFSL